MKVWFFAKHTILLQPCLTVMSDWVKKYLMNAYRIGLDIGSTTAKMVVLDETGEEIVLDAYRRHQAKVKECLADFLGQLSEKLGSNAILSVSLTGSVGMGVAERCSLPFVQEVVAASNYLRKYYPMVSTMIDIGGEDAKMVFLSNGQPEDLRMNGNCAGGTGAFIDQMAILLGVSSDELGVLAEKSTRTYPIASRCGVFCKTDIQNLIARNVPREDIAASIFHAVSVQTIVTLAHGHDVTAPLLLCGGPLTFIPALRKAFSDYLHLPEHSFYLPEKANLVPAWGAALSEGSLAISVSELVRRLEKSCSVAEQRTEQALPPIFGNREEYEEWKLGMSHHAVAKTTLKPGRMEAVIGIDSGSTTTKIVVLDRKGRMLYSHYRDNNGHPVKAVEEGLQELLRCCHETGTELQVAASCSTGYGEDLIKAAFRMDAGIIETMAHYMAARHINQDVSFILDIGGQDMKAIFVENGVINRIEVNEACSSGCGSFISTFARSLNCTVEEFSEAACLAPEPCDLGTRCTVFMNSKVKQVLREGASMADIAAGLSYSVVKNCLYKVLRLKDTKSLGDNILVQGGTMRNDSIVRALERLTEKSVFRSDCPELMGALGCALYAEQITNQTSIPLQEMVEQADYTSKQLFCHGCENQCTVTRYRFGNDNVYFSGNRCEKVFNNKGEKAEKGLNAYEEKRKLLFDRESSLPHPFLTIGIPRCLNMYEEYPFWYTLFTGCNIRVLLSDLSDFAKYEQCAGKVMSDNICFPAKLVHSHIDNLLQQHADRIFMPFVLFERPDKQMQNSYNCPVVSGYSQVIRNVQAGTIPIDTPTISFKKRTALWEQCREYLLSIGVEESVAHAAFRLAEEEQKRFECEVAACNRHILEEARRKDKLIILLAGRPYHSDALVQHKVSEMIAALGACVLTDDLVRGESFPLSEVNYLSQWAFTNRIVKSAQWAAGQGDDVQYMQLTSFGCGPDAFLTDEVQALLKRSGKNLTLLKIDDVNNIGSLKLRVRSLLESLRIGLQKHRDTMNGVVSLPAYTSVQAKKKIIVPFFTPFISPLIPSLLALAGYDADNLPMSDAASCDWGLKFSNNEVCYPATLIVGDIVKAFRSGSYSPENTCVAITQTGGQCRASNYLSLIRKALVENGYTHTPVVSISLGSGIDNHQPGFKVNWLKLLPVALSAILYSDCIAKFYYASVIREKKSGEAVRLRDYYLELAQSAIRKNRPQDLYCFLSQAVDDFERICRREKHPKVGIVGEIFLKYHPFAQKYVTDWLVERQIEVAFPTLIDFFQQSFVNMKENKRSHLAYKYLPGFLIDKLHGLVQRQIDKVNAIGKKFYYFTPFDNIFEKAEQARPVISLNAQFGEGWLIPGEMATLASQGVTHIVSLQPFGCIANHIVEKGIENRIKSLYPGVNILSLDFDSSVSEVNITNRLLLFIDNLRNTGI